MVPDPLKGHRDQKKSRGVVVAPPAKLPVTCCGRNKVDLEMGRPALCDPGKSHFSQYSLFSFVK